MQQQQAEQSSKRRLAAVLSADVAGFSRLMQADEEGTHKLLADRRAVLDGAIAARGGRIVGTAGDSVLAEFPSVLEAVRAAIDAQRRLEAANAGLPTANRLEFRIGINLGDVIVDGADIFGDGINIAARLQGLAEPGGICISEQVEKQVRNKLDCRVEAMAPQRVKNIADPIAAFRLICGAPPQAPAVPAAGRHRTRWRPLAAVLLGLVLIAAAGAAFWQWQGAGRQTEAPLPGEGHVDGRPGVAVLPFDNQGAEDWFSHGLTEDLIAALGRFPTLSVLSHRAAMASPGPEAPAVAGQRLGVRYIVAGSVRRQGERVRVTAQLIDAVAGRHLWSERFDRELRDLFAVQDEITRGIAGALAGRIGRLELERAMAKPAADLAAYDLVLRGRARMFAASRADIREARDFFARAMALDPDYAAAHAGLGWAHYVEVISGWTELLDEGLRQAEAKGQQALALDPFSADAHRLLGYVHLYRRRYSQALSELALALEVNPSDAGSHAGRGAVLMWAGEADAAIEALETAFRFDPNPGYGAFLNLGLAYYLAGRYEDAARLAETGLARDTLHLTRIFGRVTLAAALARLGRGEEAALAREALLEVAPFFSVELFTAQFQRAADRRHMAEGLRGAGLR